MHGAQQGIQGLPPTQLAALEALGLAKRVITSEALSAGDFVNLYLGDGLRVRKANAAAATIYKSHGFVLSNVGNGAVALVQFVGINNKLSGLVVGTRQYLSTTAGARIGSASVTGSGNLIQLLGIAISTTELLYIPNDGTTLA